MAITNREAIDRINETKELIQDYIEDNKSAEHAHIILDALIATSLDLIRLQHKCDDDTAGTLLIKGVAKFLETFASISETEH